MSVRYYLYDTTLGTYVSDYHDYEFSSRPGVTVVHGGTSGKVHCKKLTVSSLEDKYVCSSHIASGLTLRVAPLYIYGQTQSGEHASLTEHELEISTKLMSHLEIHRIDESTGMVDFCPFENFLKLLCVAKVALGGMHGLSAITCTAMRTVETHGKLPVRVVDYLPRTSIPMGYLGKFVDDLFANFPNAYQNLGKSVSVALMTYDEVILHQIAHASTEYMFVRIADLDTSVPIPTITWSPRCALSEI